MPTPADRSRFGRGTWRDTDPGLLVSALGVSFLGVLLAWSATRHDSGHAFLVRGMVNLVVAVALGAGVMVLDRRVLRALAPVAYAVGFIGLALVLSPVGSTVNGSRSWIELPGFSVQPAELAKVSLVVAMASVLADAGDGRFVDPAPRWRELRVALALAAGLLGLIMLQPDLGSALIVLAAGLCVLAAAGVHRGWIIGALGGIVLGITLALTTPLLAQYQRDRLLAFIRPQADPTGIGYQVSQVKLAIGSGGLTGQGLFSGRSTQGGFIPFQYTDFIFSVAGEELGLVGAFGLVGLELFLVWRILVVGRRTDDAFGRIVCAGVAGWLLFQTLENVGMNLGLMPVTGVPLPFVSYGGSSLFACWIAVGLVGNVHSAHVRRLS